MKAQGEAYPLTPLQLGLLFHTLQAPEHGHYVAHAVWHLSGPLNVEALRESWARLLICNPILRSIIRWGEVDPPQQIIRPEIELDLHREDWTRHAAVEQDRRLTRYLRGQRRTGLSLS